jgi:hypothetical protein
LSHFPSPFVMGFSVFCLFVLRCGLTNYFPRAGFESPNSQSLCLLKNFDYRCESPVSSSPWLLWIPPTQFLRCICDFSVAIICSWCHERGRKRPLWRILLFTLSWFCYLSYRNSISSCGDPTVHAASVEKCAACSQYRTGQDAHHSLALALPNGDLKLEHKPHLPSHSSRLCTIHSCCINSFVSHTHTHTHKSWN